MVGFQSVNKHEDEEAEEAEEEEEEEGHSVVVLSCGHCGFFFNGYRTREHNLQFMLCLGSKRREKEVM